MTGPNRVRLGSLPSRDTSASNLWAALPLLLKNPANLTSREIEVLQAVAEGKATKETADWLHISIKTVEKHRQKVMENSTSMTPPVSPVTPSQTASSRAVCRY
ncbi:MAG: helix-turn-helix transcriptional regulator [Verrucomicrobiota bacterium]